MPMSAFWDAVRSGDRSGLENLVKDDPALVTTRDDQGATAVQVAVYHRQLETARWLAEHGGIVDFYSAVVLDALESPHFQPPPGQIDGLSPDGFTALCLASAFGSTTSVRRMLAWGADPNARSTSLGGVAPLHAAVFGWNLGAVELLLEAGADPEAPQQGGFTALMGAAQNGDAAIAALLIRHGADRTLKNDQGLTAEDYGRQADLDLAAL